jgi:hypothetical protein
MDICLMDDLQWRSFVLPGSRRERPIQGFHRVLPQTSKHLSPLRRSEGNYTSLLRLRTEQSRLRQSREFIKIRTVRNSAPVRGLPPVDSLRVPQKERTEGIGAELGWDSQRRQFREPDHEKKPGERAGIHGSPAGKVVESDSVRDLADC